MGAGGLHTQSLRRVKTGELMWRQEVRWISVPGSTCICISFFKFRNFLAFLPFPPIHNTPHVGQQDNIHGFFPTHFIIKMFKQNKIEIVL